MNNITKKAYVKPDIALVDFSLSSSIAAVCSKEGLQSADACGAYEENGWTVYTTDICDIDASDKELCYHVPTEDSRFFGS